MHRPWNGLGALWATLGNPESARFFVIFVRVAVVTSANLGALKCVVWVSRGTVFRGCLWGSPWNASLPGFRGVSALEAAQRGPQNRGGLREFGALRGPPRHTG